MVYLDHNATTPLAVEAWEAMRPFLQENWANPASGYRFARVARRAVETAREQVAALIGAEPEEIVFTSGGTESITTAVHAAAAVYPERRHLITGATEHEAMLAPAAALEQQGWEVTRLGVDAEGRLDLAALRAALRPGATALVSIMAANNETGVRHPITEAAAMAAEQGVLFHTDAVQAAGKVPLDLGKTAVAYASLSAHKVQGPKGTGALYVRKTARFHPLQPGGGQEGGRRGGTLNVAGIVGFGAAAAAARAAVAEEATNGALARRRDHFEAELARRIEGVVIHGRHAPRVPNTSNFHLPGIDAQGAVILLDTAGFCVSTGSACATGSLQPSHVLVAMGLPTKAARETLRVSLSRATTDEEVAQALAALETAAAKLRVTRPGLVSS